MVNLIRLAQKYREDKVANQKKSLREQAELRKESAAKARQNLGQPNVIEGASVELPVGDNTNLVESVGIDARGKNLDTDTEKFGDTALSNRRLVQTEPMITPDKPEKQDEIARIDQALKTAALNNQDPVDILIREQMKRGTVKTDGTVDFSREAAYDVVMEEINNAKARNAKTTPDSFSWDSLNPVSAGEALGLDAKSNKNSLKTLADNAKYINKAMNNTLPSVFEQNMDKPQIQRLANLLTSYGLLNNVGGKITVAEKFGNALTLQLIETFNDEIARKDKFKDNQPVAEQERESMLLDSEILLRAKDDANPNQYKYPKYREKFLGSKASGKPDSEVEAERITSPNDPFNLNPDLNVKVNKTQKNLGREFMFSEAKVAGQDKKTARAMARADADLRYLMVQIGTAFNPDYTRGTLAKGLLNKLVKNPNEVAEGVIAGSGTSGDIALNDKNKPDDEVGLLSILDQMLWQIAKQQGFLDLIEEVDSVTGLPTEAFYVVSPKGEDFFVATRDIYAKVKKEREGVAKARPIIGQVIASYDRESNRPISLKAMRDANVVKENRIKDKLGAMPYTVIEGRFNFLEKLVLEKKGGVIILSDDGRPVKLANMPTTTTTRQVIDEEATLKARPLLYFQALDKDSRNKNIERSGAPIAIKPLTPEEEQALQFKPIMKSISEETPSNRFFSNHEFASALGLDEQNWTEAFYGGMETAQANGITDEIDLQEYGERQANAVMRDKAGEIFRDYQEAATEINKVYYNKWMHASSVGRYFMRQQVLNAMNSKAVRNIVGSAMPRTFNFNKPMSTKRPAEGVYSESEIYESWRVIIGANLLGPRELTKYKGQKTSSMNYDSILARTDMIMSKGMQDETYSNWVEKGRKLRTFVLRGNSAPLSELSKYLSPSDLKSFQKKSDEWGFKLQSYIDFANWHEAKKNKGTFQALAQTSADGIQSGLTIQALQNGDLDILKLVGLIYQDGDNILPEGDIRQRFWENIDGTAEIAFAHDKDKVSFWADFINEVNDADGKQSIIKDLAKQPLMETSYGRSIKFNHQAISKFLLEHGPLMQKVMDKNKTYYYNEGDTGHVAMVRDFNHMLGLGLLRTLDYGHQKTVSNVGLVWSWLDMNGFYEGPNGTYQFIGSRETVPTGNEIEIIDNESGIGGYTIKEMTSRATGSAPSTPGITYNPETGAMEKKSQSRYGQEVSNQLVVLPIQQVDGAAMGNSIDKVNTKTVMDYNSGYPLFLFPVHDSITCDCNSLRQYHKTINDELISINKTWKKPRAIVNGLLDGLRKKESNLQNKQMYMLTSNQLGIESMHTHRALHSFFLQIDNALKEGKNLEISTTAQLQGKTTKLASTREDLIRDARALGWKPEGGKVSGENLKKLIQLGIRYLKVIPELQNWEKANIYNRLEHLGKINEERSNYAIGL